jgi:hypothetical protein
MIRQLATLKFCNYEDVPLFDTIMTLVLSLLKSPF